MSDDRCSQCEAIIDVADSCYECLTAPPPKPTHCPHGHEYTEETIIITSLGRRRCRRCDNQWGMDCYNRKKAAKAASRSAA